MNPLAAKILKRVGFGLLGTVAYSILRDQMRYRSLRGAVVLISGGSRGLGLVLAQEYAAEGASICLLARDDDELRRAQNIIFSQHPDTIVHIKVCDSTKLPQVEEAVAYTLEMFGKIDVVVNCAGTITSMPVENATKKDFTESLDVHFWAPFNVIRTCLPYLRRGARIVNIASIGGLIPVPHLAPYCTGKFALVGYSQTLRAELMRKGIYVTTACPGLIRTGSADHAKFKGQVKKEYAWFSTIGSLPIITTSAERAARQIVHATKIGEAEVTVQVSTKLVAIMQAHFPNLFSDFLAVANMVLPGPAEFNSPAVEGKDAHSVVSPSVITTLSQRAAARNNERPNA